MGGEVLSPGSDHRGVQISTQHGTLSKAQASSRSPFPRKTSRALGLALKALFSPLVGGPLGPLDTESYAQEAETVDNPPSEPHAINSLQL